jgi:large subunit ribosomal protein L15
MRLPKRGFSPPNRARFAWVNLNRLQKAIDAKKLDANDEITEAVLVEAGLVRRRKDGVRLLAQGELKTKVKLIVTGASAAAVKAVEKAGGSVTLLKPATAEPAG